MVKNLRAMQEAWVQSLVRKIPWRRKWQPTPAFLPGESHGQRLVGESPWNRKLSDMTEQLTLLLLPPKSWILCWPSESMAIVTGPCPQDRPVNEH